MLKFHIIGMGLACVLLYYIRMQTDQEHTYSSWSCGLPCCHTSSTLCGHPQECPSWSHCQASEAEKPPQALRLHHLSP